MTDREGAKGKGRVTFISCSLWIQMMVHCEVTMVSGYADLLTGGKKTIVLLPHLCSTHSCTRTCVRAARACARRHA